jgi:Fe2+ transport system protein FeoA
MMSESEPVRLDELSRHQRGVVHHVEAPDDEMARLMSLGVCEGRTIEMVNRGDPLILKVFGSRVGVSARLARRVMVTRCSAGPCALDLNESVDESA